MPVKNPRFPHYCRITRKTVSDPMEDEDDFSPYTLEQESDTDYDPMGDDVSQPQGSPSMAMASEVVIPVDDEGDGETQETVVYEGICRSYAKNATSDKGEVITSYRGLSLPVTEDDWTALGIVPKEGDELVVDRGSFKEYGRIIDKNPANFHGTHLTWHYGRN